MRGVFALALLAIAAPMARADGDDSPQLDGGERTHRLNLRIGVSNTDTNGRPTICMEVTAYRSLSVEGCGTGSGLLHSESGAELAHFRAKWSFFEADTGSGTLRTQVAAGFAELQLDADEPGFVFGKPDDAEPIEVAGPESSLSVQWLSPLGDDFELVSNVNAGLAWLPHAGELVVPQSRLQTFISLEVGVGW